MYYLRTRAAADAIKFTVDQTALAAAKQNEADQKLQEQQQQQAKKAASANAAATASGSLSPEPATPVDIEAVLLCSRENPDACVMCSG